MGTIRHKKMARSSALYALLYDLLTDLTTVRTAVTNVDTEYDKLVTAVNSIRTQLIAAIDDDDNFRTAYDAAAALKTRYSLGSPEAEDDNQVVVSEDIPAQSGTLTIAANPDVPRNLTFTATVGGSLDVLFTAVGVDQFGEAVTETFNVVSAAEVTGSKVFKTVTSITATTVTDDTGVNTIIVGTGSVLGLPVQITQAADVPQAFLNNVLEGTSPTAEATYHSVTLNSALNGTEVEVVVSRDSVGATAKTAADPDANAAGAATIGSIASTAPEPKSTDPLVDN